MAGAPAPREKSMRENITLGIHRMGDAYRGVVSAVKPLSTTSRFTENGTLTAEEFIQAGDQLAFKFPTWQWEAGDPSKRASYLPQDKQFLITRNVPCRDRVRALDYVLTHKTRTEEEWLLPETAQSSADDSGAAAPDLDDLIAARTGDGKAKAAPAPKEEEPETSGGFGGFGGICIAQEDFISAPSASAAPAPAPAPKPAVAAPAAPKGVMDFSDLDAELAEEDPACAGGSSSSAYFVADAPDVHIVRTRTYDLSITYDKYYQTPRLWLFGYNEAGEPLTPEDVYEDVLSEYVAKTVTVDPHPLSGTPTVSIHPCKHAQVMKKVIDDWVEAGIEPRHDLALFVFLKFISGVVPTINYDFTMDIEF